jgi:endoglucanase
MTHSVSRRALLAALAAGACEAPSPPSAQAATTLFTGVNIAGLEFNSGRLPGRVGTDYPAPNPAEILYYRSRGARTMRLPFLWERLQPTLNGSFDSAYLGLIDQVVALGRDNGIKIVLDAHQYGRRKAAGQSYKIGETSTVTTAHFAQFWRALAGRFRSSNVIFNLTNEPHDQNLNTLVSVQNSVIGAIRDANASQLILVSGGAWSGAHSWVSSGNGAAMLAIRDPGNNYAFDVHQYLDGNSSGAEGVCVSGSGRRLSAFTAWARTNRRRGFLGEFAGGANTACANEMTDLLRHMRDNRDVWIGWTYWAGGAWWPESYHFNIRPASLTAPVERPQMTTLRRYFE